MSVEHAEVEILAEYHCANVNLRVLESLIHRFFSKACLDIDLYHHKTPYNPREWFVVPLPLIDEAIQLLKNESIINYYYDNKTKKIKLKK